MKLELKRSRLGKDLILLDDEAYVGTHGLWSPKTYTKEDYERYKELLHETNVMYMTLKVVILELTDQQNGTKFCVQYVKSPSRKESYRVAMMMMRRMAMKNISVQIDDSMFEELIPKYISDHVLC